MHNVKLLRERKEADMKIGDHLVNTPRQFREYFDFEIIWSCWKSFIAESASMGFDKDEVELFGFCDYCFNHKGERIDTELSFDTEGPVILKYIGKEYRFQYLQSATITNWLTDHYFSSKELPPIVIAQVLLSEIARKPVLNGKFNTEKNEPACDEIRLENIDTPYQFNAYTYQPKCLPMEIRTVKIHNVSSSGLGYATIQILGKSNTLLKSVKLFKDEIIFANFVGDEIIELFPLLDLSCDHVTYHMFLSRDMSTMGRQMNISKDIFEYNSDKVGRICQFSADDEGGFVGISDKKIVSFSKIFQRNSFDFVLEKDEYPVKIAVCGGSYIMLSNKGKTYSNCNLNKENIVSVYMTEEQVAVVITVDGKMVSNRKIKDLPVGSVKPFDIFICNNDMYALKCYDGKILASFVCDSELYGMNKISFLKQRLVYLNGEGGLFFRNTEKDEKIAEDVKFFKVNANWLAYYCTNRCVIYES